MMVLPGRIACCGLGTCRCLEVLQLAFRRSTCWHERSLLLEDEDELIFSSGNSLMDTRYYVNVDRIVAAQRRKELEGSIRHALEQICNHQTCAGSGRIGDSPVGL